MTRCLSDQALLECYTREGDSSALAHLKNCLACAGRYRTLQSDLTLISQTLEMAPPRRRAAVAAGFAGWRLAASAMALAAAFTVGWSLHDSPLTQSARMVSHGSSSVPVEVSRLETSPSSAVYAEYVQGAFEGDTCTDADDPVGLGCP